MTFNRVVFSSKSYKWNTPDEAYKELDQEFHFSFDPAVPPRVGNFSGNGLKESWIPKIKTGKRSLYPRSRVFCNPPYKRKLTLRWVLKGWRELVAGNVELIVFLLPLRNSDYMRFLTKVGAEYRLNNGRLKFGDATESAPFDSMIAILTQKNVENRYV